MSASIELVLSVAGEFPVTDVHQRDEGFDCTLTVALPSGERLPFDLEVRSGPVDHVIAKERPPGRLPRCCPERHITPKSIFCLNWMAGDPHPVTDIDSARSWWATLWDFLTRQDAASKIRRWPGPVRAHGDAVIHQDRAERCAPRLGASVAARVAQGDFTARIDQRRGRNRIELLEKGKVVNRINVSSRALTNQQMRCLCPNGIKSNVSIAHCEDHASTLAELISALHRWSDGERKYFAQLREAGAMCCHTLEHCPLK